MADLLDRAATWLAGKLKTNVSTTVTYRRGAQSVSMVATLSSVLLRVQDGLGVSKIERTDRDFVVTAADLILGTVVTTPKRNDFLDVVFGTTTHRFVVLPFGDEPEWRWSDQHNKSIRVHAKYVGTVA